MIKGLENNTERKSYENRTCFMLKKKRGGGETEGKHDNCLQTHKRMF